MSIAANTSFTNASSSGAARKLTEIARRGVAVRAKRADESGGLIEHRNVRVPKAVDRLLSIADDEDRRGKRVGRGAEALAPAPDQVRDEIPLRPARVLELVDEHVAVPRFELVAALRELVHLLEQLDRPLEHA